MELKVEKVLISFSQLWRYDSEHDATRRRNLHFVRKGKQFEILSWFGHQFRFSRQVLLWYVKFISLFFIRKSSYLFRVFANGYGLKHTSHFRWIQEALSGQYYSWWYVLLCVFSGTVVSRQEISLGAFYVVARRTTGIQFVDSVLELSLITKF